MSRLDELQSSNEWNPSVAAPHSGGVRNKFFKFGTSTSSNLQAINNAVIPNN